MKNKHLLIAALILLGLVIYYSLFEYRAPSEDPRAKLGIPLLALRPEEVKQIEIKRAAGGELIVKREGKWIVLKGNTVENVDMKVNDFIVELLGLVEIEKFQADNAQLKEYGLDKPAFQITITDVTDKTYQILTGDSNPVKTCIYVKFAESPQVIVLGALLSYELEKISPLFVSE